MITIKENKGFALTFENGLHISVMIGTMNYCSRRTYHADYQSELKTPQEDGTFIVESLTAEIAIFERKENGESGRWLKIGHDTVAGHILVSEIAEWIAKIGAAKDFDELQSITPFTVYEEEDAD